MHSVHPGSQSLMCRSHPCSFCLYLAISLGWNLITFSKFSNVTSRNTRNKLCIQCCGKCKNMCVLFFLPCTHLYSAFFCWVVFELGPFWAKQLVTVALSDAAGSSFSPKDRLFGDNSARHTGLGAYIWIPQRLPFHSRNFKQEYTIPKIYLSEGLKILCFWSKAVKK